MDASELYARYAAGERDFSGLTFENISLNIAGLEEPAVESNVLDNIDFSRTKFESCDFSYVNFRHAKFVDSTMNGGEFVCTNFTGADLRNSKFMFTEYATGIDFTDADLRGACIDASLDGANLTRANLKGGDIAGGGEDVICSETIMPDGSIRNGIQQ